MASANRKPSKKSLFHNLGEFVGHIAQGIKSDPGAPGPSPQNPASSGPELEVPMQPLAPVQIVRTQTQERHVNTAQGKLVLRRTIIDEVQRTDDQP